MTLPRLKAIADRWEVTPPLSVMVTAIASALGYQGKTRSSNEQGDFQGLVDTLSTAGFQSGVPEWLKQARAAEAAATTTSS